MNINKKGFTLIELVTVIVILAVLAAIIYPKVRENIEQAQNNNFTTLIGNAKTATEMFYTECVSGTITDTECDRIITELTNNHTSTITSRILLKYNLLKPSNIPDEETSSDYEIYDPRTKENITEKLQIKITKGENYEYTFEVNCNDCQYDKQ